MLSFSNEQDLDLTLKTMRFIGNQNDYLQDELLPALLRGKWDELEKMVVYQDEKKTILFGDDIWAFRETAYKGKNVANFHFYLEKKQETNIIEFRQNEHTLINQMKCMAVCYLWFSGRNIELNSLTGSINSLKLTIRQLINRGITSFEELNLERLKSLADDDCFDLSYKNVFKGLNALFFLKGLLPFKINYPSLTHKMFNTIADDHEGNLVIPPRIYFATLTRYSEDIVKAYAIRDEIEQVLEHQIYAFEQKLNKTLLKIRNGKRTYTPSKDYAQSWSRFTHALDQVGVTLVDKGEDPRWMEIYKSLNTKILIKDDHPNIRINNQTFTCRSDFNQYLSTLNAKALWLCLALSGMRINELHKMSPVYGAQIIKFDKTGCESDIGKEIIYFLTTRQSKITLNSQTKDDTFVTTEVGYKAFHVLNALHTPFRKRFTEENSNRMFGSIITFRQFEPVGINAVAQTIIKAFNAQNFDFTLSSADIGYLQTSDPKQTVFKQGDKFHFNCHQTRRSLAYYLIGYELCSFPALKQQLSHLSMAMTRWYARNAHSFEKLYSEIQKERIIQQAEIFARLYQKIANGERIAGGKGQAIINEISREGKDYFENGLNKRKLSREYWIDLLTRGKTHLHAVAPGMYCTNTQCSMRINIDLSECVDCEFDFIENVVYAESSRMDAMRNFEFLKETNELNSSAATKYFMQIKAAEAIMEELGFIYDRYVFAEDVLSLVIPTIEVA